MDRLVEEGIAVFHGFREDPRPFYANADCVVLPSYHEGMSNVLLEAAASGRCIVTSNIPGCRETVENMQTGFLCEVKNEESLYMGMKSVAVAKKDCLKNYGLLGREYVSERFNKAYVVEKTIDEMFN